VPWPVKFGEREVAPRVVRHLDRQLEAGAGVERLERHWHVFQGVQSGADAYTQRIRKRLTDEAVAELDRRGARIGDRILELPPGREHESPWNDAPDLLARAPEPRALLYGAIDEADYGSIVWIDRDDSVPSSVVAALEPFKPLLETRADFVANPDRRWFETHRARDKTKLREPKVIALYRTDRGRFALDETGEWQPSIKATVCTPREDGLSVAYLCGLLNSELLDLWYALRGKTPRDVWRNYEPKPMNRMPYRHVPGLVGSEPRPDARRVAEQLAAGDAPAVLGLAESMSADALALAQVLELLVRAITQNRRALLAQRSLAPALRRQVKDPWSDTPVELSVAGLVAEMPPAATRSVRLLDDRLSVAATQPDLSGAPALDEQQLVLRRSRQEIATVEGPRELLEILHAVLDGRRVTPDELRATVLPADLDAFRAFAQQRTALVAGLVRDGRLLVEAAERVVCKLYAVPPALTADVVAHAVSRANRRTPKAAEGEDA